MPSIVPAEDDPSSAMPKSFAQAVSALHINVCALYRVAATDNTSTLIRRENRESRAKRSTSYKMKFPQFFFEPETTNKTPVAARQNFNKKETTLWLKSPFRATGKCDKIKQYELVKMCMLIIYYASV